MWIRITSLLAEEFSHKMNALLDTEDLVDGYSLSEADVVAKFRRASEMAKADGR